MMKRIYFLLSVGSLILMSCSSLIQEPTVPKQLAPFNITGIVVTKSGMPIGDVEVSLEAIAYGGIGEYYDWTEKDAVRCELLETVSRSDIPLYNRIRKEDTVVINRVKSDGNSGVFSITVSDSVIRAVNGYGPEEKRKYSFLRLCFVKAGYYVYLREGVITLFVPVVPRCKEENATPETTEKIVMVKLE